MRKCRRWWNAVRAYPERGYTTYDGQDLRVLAIG
jgi:hypothetical protein